MSHARLDPGITRGVDGRFALRIKISQFDGETPDEQLDAALEWCGFIDSEVHVDLEHADVGEIACYGLPHVTFVNRRGE